MAYNNSTISQLNDVFAKAFKVGKYKMNHKIVLLSGKQGSGKSTLQKTLMLATKRFKSYDAVCMNFADPIYEMHDFCRGTLKAAGITPPHEVKDGNLLQVLGTEWGRNTVDRDLWVKMLQGRVNKLLEMRQGNGLNYFFIVGDCRFENELDLFPDAYKVRLECAKETRRQRCSMWRENDTHPSEIGLDAYAAAGKFDKRFDSGIETPEHMAELILDQLMRQSYLEKR